MGGAKARPGGGTPGRAAWLVTRARLPRVRLRRLPCECQHIGRVALVSMIDRYALVPLNPDHRLFDHHPQAHREPAHTGQLPTDPRHHPSPHPQHPRFYGGKPIAERRAPPVPEHRNWRGSSSDPSQGRPKLGRDRPGHRRPAPQPSRRRGQCRSVCRRVHKFPHKGRQG